MWYKNPKLWGAVISQIVAVVMAIVIFINPGESVVQLVSAILTGISQVLAIILGAMWGSEYRNAKVAEKLQEPPE